MSIRSDLYRYIKAVLTADSFTDCLDTVHTFSADLGVKHVAFWNSELAEPEKHSNFKTPAVFFELKGNDNMKPDLQVSVTDDRATTQDQVSFVLHFVGGKRRHESETDEDYLELIDIADAVFSAINGKSFAGCKDIFRIDEVQDINSEVLMDYQSTYRCVLINFGETSLTDTSPVEVEIQGIIPHQPSQEGIGAMFIEDDFVVE